ncbi:serine/threonine-protein kinase, partial [Mesorhizobium sp.]
MSDDDKTRISANVTYAGVGTQLSGIYELDERIASGGMGEVYRGHNIQTGDHVAIKIVLPEFARDQTILSLFRKEASILNHLSHDAVVRYHVFTIDPGIGRPYLAMEFVDGQSLFDIMRRGPMPSDDVRRLCHRLASGLSAVHQAGAVHRDLSPDNIILPGGRVERAKIIDFGIARSATGGETLIGGKFAGKYNYVSPEQLGLYGGEVSEQSDIYSLGLVLAAALRGKPLDMSGSQYEVIEKRRTVPDLSDIDPDFHELIEAMLQPDPRDRPASMAEIARATRGEDLEPTLP